LNLFTIDSLSASLSGALPLLSQTGTLPNIEENAYLHYITAAERMLQEVDGDGDLAKNIKTLLVHKDNNLKQVTELIAELLAKRLQWLAKTALTQADFEHSGYQYTCVKIFDSLEIIIEEKLQEVYEALPSDIVSELPCLLQQAAEVLFHDHKDSVSNLVSNSYFDAIEKPNSSDLQLWLAIAEMLLKADKNNASFFASPNKNIGFPTKADAKNDQQAGAFVQNKEKLKAILTDLSDSPNGNQIASLLNQVRHLPTNIESEVENPVLKAVTELLPAAASYLKLVFIENNVIDFTELSIASLEALGSENAPTDFALALDYRIEHILLDEFQDTSSPQIRLIELLTAGWDASQSKSLFLVGDPMQSIYRFRDANVSLFLKVIDAGIGQIKPVFRQLEVNFRSSQTIIEWVNLQFAELMPAQSDLTFSAVKYSPSTAFHTSSLNTLDSKLSEIKTCVTLDAEDHTAEASEIVALIESHLLENANLKKNICETGSTEIFEAKTLAILVKKRSYLVEIIELLNQKSISFQALDLESLTNKIIVSDITCLALALTDIYDQLSWVACLRSPWYSLSINDIKLIVSFVTSTGSSFPTAINYLAKDVSADASADETDSENNNIELIDARDKCNLSIEGKLRISIIQPILNHAIALKGKKPFIKWLSGCFDAVGGCFQIDTASEHKDLDTCIETIAKFELGGEIIDRKGLQSALEKLYAAPNPNADNQIQLMTIHKSKGLEFDTVILPRTDDWRSRPDTPLLKWTEVLDNYGTAHNLLAVSKETGKDNDSIYQYISYIEKQKEKYEAQRLLYVAATRAKSKLYLFGNVCVDNKKSNDEYAVYKKPTSNSFLAMLWNGVKDDLNLIAMQRQTDASLNRSNPQKLNEAELAEMTELSSINKQLETIFPARKFKRIHLEHIESVPSKTNMDEKARDNIRNNDSAGKFEKGMTEQNQDISSAIIGKVVHRQLEWLSNQFSIGSNSPSEYVLPAQWSEITKSQLIVMGCSEGELNINISIALVVKAIENTLADEMGQFILTSHPQAKSELILQMVTAKAGYQTRIVDRTFVVEGERWIVDYKTSQQKKEEG
ncbi:MAG: UvrD-helicase domain-containing protein, partial [Kangiellaceae bacterium]|nr:UvrD-helicase domain-containing protein [Kangiellaceae bacterium]